VEVTAGLWRCRPAGASAPLPASPRYVLLVTAGVSMWNMGGGYLAGLLLSHCFQREWLRA